jgi:hypothetical protein
MKTSDKKYKIVKGFEYPDRQEFEKEFLDFHKLFEDRVCSEPKDFMYLIKKVLFVDTLNNTSYDRKKRFVFLLISSWTNGYICDEKFQHVMKYINKKGIKSAVNNELLTTFPQLLCKNT